MKATIKASIAAHSHDLRIDFVRGLANWFMLVDHIPHSVVNLFTMRNFGFSGAVDLFAFASGYGAALLFGSMMVERGFVIAASRILKRAWQLYAAHLVLFVVYINAISWVAAHYAAPDLFEEYHVIGILNDPVRVLMHGLMLEARPLNLDVLQMAIVLLALFPLSLASLLRWPNLTMLGSVVLYLAAREFNLGLPAYPAGSAVYLNPFCWQLLFVLGSYLALHGGKLVGALQELRTLRLLAMAYLVLSLLVMVGAEVPAIGGLLPDVLVNAFIPIDRENLGPARILHLLCLAVQLFRAGGLEGIPFEIPAADHEMRRRMAGVLLRRHLPRACRQHGPDHEPEHRPAPGAGQRRRARIDDGRRILCILVAAAGSPAEARGADAERSRNRRKVAFY